MSYVSTGNIVIIQKQQHHIDRPQLGASIADDPSPTVAPPTLSPAVRHGRVSRKGSNDSGDSGNGATSRDGGGGGAGDGEGVSTTDADEDLPPSPTDLSPPGSDNPPRSKQPATSATAKSQPTAPPPHGAAGAAVAAELAAVRTELSECQRALDSERARAAAAAAAAEETVAAEKRRVAVLERKNGELLAEVPPYLSLFPLPPCSALLSRHSIARRAPRTLCFQCMGTF